MINKHEKAMSCEQLDKHIRVIEKFARKSKKHRRRATARAKNLRTFQNEKCKQEAGSNDLVVIDPGVPGAVPPPGAIPPGAGSNMLPIGGPTPLPIPIPGVPSSVAGINTWVLVAGAAAVWYFFFRRK